jgi:hypothetical protein
MPFSFLNPWFWLGALAVAGPLWLHLRRRQESNLFRFSAVRFLADELEPRRSPLQVQNWFLLALRVLALLLIVAAFAWPYLKGSGTLPVRESRVYILDNTLSHQANDGFLQDRDRILKEIKSSGSQVQNAVIELTSGPRVLVSFGDNAQAAAERLTGLQPSFQRGSYLAAFRMANSLLAHSLGAEKRIILCGDDQENQWKENVNTPPFLRDVQVDLPAPPAKSLPNLSLFEPRTQRIFLGDRSLVHFTLKLRHTGPARNATVVLRANDQTIFNRKIELEDQPETIQLQAQWEAEPGAWIRGQATVEGTPDALAGDNTVYFSLAPVVEGKVALLAQSPYLRLALSPDIMRGQWATRLLDPTQLEAELARSSDADVFCLESNYLQSSAARKLVARYLANNHGVLLFVNRLTPAIEGYLRELGFEAQGTVSSGPEGPDRFQFIFSNHPIFHPFLSPDYGNLMDIKLWQYVRLKASSAMPLIFSERGAGLFFQGTQPSGKLFVAAFGADREHTSWPVDQTFIPFLDLTLQAARAEDPAPTSFEPGDVGTVTVPPGSPDSEMVLRDENREIERIAPSQGRAQIRFPDRPGHYLLMSGIPERVLRVYNVNPSPKESLLTYAEADDILRNWRQSPSTRAVVPPSGQLPTQPRLSGILQQRVWWWMVLGALLALMLEMVSAEARRESK